MQCESYSVKTSQRQEYHFNLDYLHREGVCLSRRRSEPLNGFLQSMVGDQGMDK